MAAQADIILLDFDEEMIQWDVSSVEKSGLTVSELTEVLQGMSSSIEYFINLKNSELFAEIDVEDYPVHMEGETEDVNEIIEGISPSFLLIGLIEFCLIKKSENELLDYLKSSRIPQAKKYAKQLKKWYEASGK